MARRTARRGGFLAIVLAFLLALGWALAQHFDIELDEGAGAGVEQSMAFARCGSAPRVNCVVDGDTLYVRGENIRVEDIDAPEIRQPECEAERVLGQRATERLIALLNAGPIAVEPRGERDADRYGRKLRVITRDGTSLSDTLIAEGLARRWDGARRSWCR